MRYEVSTYGSIKDGHLTISYRQRFMESLASWDDCRVELTVKKLYRKRSNEQNSYIHLLFTDISKALVERGWNPNEVTPLVVKAWMKAKFLTVEIVNHITGETMTRVRNTSELSTIELSEFVDQIIQFAAQEIGITLFYPGEQTQASL